MSRALSQDLFPSFFSFKKVEVMPACPLCGEQKSLAFCERNDSGFKNRLYLKCPACALVFLSPEQRLSMEEEKKHYASHENDSGDKRYLEFLDRLAAPLSLKLKPGAEGLDFGCGPGPAMDLVFRQKGFSVKNYDPLYFPDKALLKQTYDFVVCSEVIEHFFEPGKEFPRLNELLKKDGFFGVMTGILEREEAFASWWYPKDPTHVCFYQRKTFEWMGRQYGWHPEFPRENIVIFQKSL